MKVEEALEIIKNYNLWRRDNDNQYEMPNPKQLGIAIDVAIKVLEEKAELNKIVCTCDGETNSYYDATSDEFYCVQCDKIY